MKFIITILCCLSFSSLKAQEDPIDTDRPDQTESPLVINKKCFQAEQGFGSETDNGVTTYGSTTLLRYGLFKNLELRFGADIIHTPSAGLSSSSTELQPVTLGIKLFLWKEHKWLPKTSLLVHSGIPFLAARSFKNFNAQPSIKLAFQNNLSELFSIGYNVGAEWDGLSNDPAFIYTFSNGIDLSKKLYGFLEIYGSIKNAEIPQHNIDGGLSLLVNNNLKLDISSGFGITSSAPAWSVAIGGSIRFQAKK